MDAELLDLISRTRPVVLEVLANRGYDVSPYENTSPEELLKMAVPNSEQLNFKVKRAVKEGDASVDEYAHVKYWVESATRQKIESILGKLWEEEPEGGEPLNPERDEVLMILTEPYHEAFDLQAIKTWSQRKARVSFFHIKHLISNPAKHSVVPPHRKLSNTEAETILAKHHIRNKMELPRIIYHVDMQARVLGLVPGDIVEIRRPSPTSGEYIIYRVCTLS
jgi:DNA-directed RNA polymerase subunit H (RpoH/RPB5)